MKNTALKLLLGLATASMLTTNATATSTLVVYDYEASNLNLNVVTQSEGYGVLFELPASFAAGAMVHMEVPLSSPSGVPIELRVYEWDPSGLNPSLIASSLVEASPQVAERVSLAAELGTAVSSGDLLAVYVVNLSPDIDDSDRQNMLQFHYAFMDVAPEGQLTSFRLSNPIPFVAYGGLDLGARITIEGSIPVVPELPPALGMFAGLAVIFLAIRRSRNRVDA